MRLRLNQQNQQQHLFFQFFLRQSVNGHVFGSALRNDFTADSDFDILVEFEPGQVPGFFGLFDMQEELSRLFGGRKVDLRTSEDLSPYIREQVLATAEVQYAR